MYRTHHCNQLRGRHRDDGWKRIYLDLPGHGRTPGKDWITNQDGMLDVVLDFIDAVIPGQRFVVAGASAARILPVAWSITDRHQSMDCY